MTTRNRRLRIAFDRDDLPLAMVNKLTTSNTAVGTDRPGHLGAVALRPQRVRGIGHRFDAGAVRAGSKLTDQRPFQEQLGEHGFKVYREER